MRKLKLAINTTYLLATLVGFGALVVTPRSARANEPNKCYQCDECHETGGGGIECSGCVEVAC